MGTDLQDLFDSFIIKIPSVDFTNKESQVIQLMKSAIGQCYRQTYDNLSYVYDSDIKEGYFNNEIIQSSIELIAMYMVKGYYSQKFAVLVNRKQYLGTKDFDKIPNAKEEYNETKQSLEYWNGEIDRLKSELPDYSDDR